MSRWRRDGGFVGLVLKGERGLVILTRHSGDCFWEAQPLMPQPAGQFLAHGEPIHGYMRELGDPVTIQPTAREYHLLMAGEPTALTATYGLLP